MRSTDIKSNNPHLAGGEKRSNLKRATCEDGFLLFIHATEGHQAPQGAVLPAVHPHLAAGKPGKAGKARPETTVAAGNMGIYIVSYIKSKYILIIYVKIFEHVIISLSYFL